MTPRTLIAATLLMGIGSTTLAHAQIACATPETCTDILSRHAPDEFDYDVLAGDIARLGADGERAVMALATEPETAAHVFALAARATAPRGLAESLLASWPAPDPSLHLSLARARDLPAARIAALRTVNGPALREASLALLRAQMMTTGHHETLSPELARAVLPALLRAATADPHPVLIQGLAELPRSLQDRAVPIFRKALRSGDAEMIVPAFRSLHGLDPERAEADLRAAFLAHPPAHSEAWARALERADGLEHLDRTEGFDASAFAYGLLGDPNLPPHRRVVALHTVLLAPATPERQVRGNVNGLLEGLTRLDPSPALARSAVTHLSMQTPNALAVQDRWWRGTPAARAFARALGTARPTGSREVLREMFARASDYRTQLAVVEALAGIGSTDDGWIAKATATHPLRIVQQTGADAIRTRPPEPPRACLAGAPRLEAGAEQMPFFASGRYADGSPAPRWQLRAAAPVPGGWLGGYDAGLIRYGSDDTATALPIAGTVTAIVADEPPAPGRRASTFWIVEPSRDVARLYRYDDGKPPAAPTILPANPRVVALPDELGDRFDGREWALAWENEGQGGQPALVITKEGRIVPACAEPAVDPYAPPRL